jgi:hypothetical protein
MYTGCTKHIGGPHAGRGLRIPALGGGVLPKLNPQM